MVHLTMTQRNQKLPDLHFPSFGSHGLQGKCLLAPSGPSGSLNVLSVHSDPSCRQLGVDVSHPINDTSSPAIAK